LVRCPGCHGWQPAVDVRGLARGARCPNCRTALPLPVLIADNNEKLAAVIAQLLADEPGFHVVDVVSTAAAAVIAAHKNPPAVVLVDRDLHDVPGLSLCSALRAAVPDAVLLLWSHDPHANRDDFVDVDGLVERGMTYRGLVEEMRQAVRRTHGERD
jgi:DNA-binding NarL/FixJ family response regulator